ncbi:MAG: Hpt domain-containing protein [Flavobacteriales bacterium]|jgi:HPt (histidine-containing phosphotransfer) domain-containing protein|nr:Hpt domain-containing protein [Flavobacteriales bacterium]
MEIQTSTVRYDLSYLNQVFQGNREMINNIINLFLQQVPEYIREMEECVRKNEPLSLHPLAHKAKSSVSMLGIKDMENDILQIEQDSKHLRNLEGLPLLVSRVRENCQIVYDQLKEALERPYVRD